MKKLKAVLVTVLLALTALVSTATAASAAAGNPTKFQPGIREAWVHFRPTMDSAYVVVSDVSLRALCYVSAADGLWNLVYDDHAVKVGYTYASYLTAPSGQWCGNVGQGTGGAKGETWVHLYPQANWAHEVMYPGHDVAAICTLGFLTDVSDGSNRRWDLYLDHANNVAGFTWYTSFYSSPSSITDCGI
ncbi:hypothetical protein DMC64_23295 [Amycolatopsis sp. WAC 04197]|uniref:hypothetical protein n=1 Tax=Amycolatopsis sp. WAC 04197 TaxID=2203199 RepID=UPI000F797CD5|nr:hypothetical protein [Amycolatopsis sp. WAC 04197]RSN43551.1 hypothetical protein DMC64_23295 [Amycolatopsis sp. WAC 04197]